jgi:hypothetical protein
MNPPESQPNPSLESLFALARARRAKTSAMEYGFETRLMARLRAQKEPVPIWGMMAWRMMPFFAACALALTVWQAQVVSEADDAAQAAAINNPTALDSWGNLEL